MSSNDEEIVTDDDITLDIYGILKITTNDATDGSIVKKAFRNLSLKFHPDKNKSPEAPKMFRLLKKAFNILQNIKSRNSYDRRRKVLVDAENERIKFVENFEAKLLELNDKRNQVIGEVLSDVTTLWNHPFSKLMAYFKDIFEVEMDQMEELDKKMTRSKNTNLHNFKMELIGIITHEMEQLSSNMYWIKDIVRELICGATFKKNDIKLKFKSMYKENERKFKHEKSQNQTPHDFEDESSQTKSDHEFWKAKKDNQKSNGTEESDHSSNKEKSKGNFKKNKTKETFFERTFLQFCRKKYGDKFVESEVFNEIFSIENNINLAGNGGDNKCTNEDNEDIKAITHQIQDLVLYDTISLEDLKEFAIEMVLKTVNQFEGIVNKFVNTSFYEAGREF